MTPQDQFGQVLMVVGAQWGDEGKGKLIDIISSEYHTIARCQGGANAGHTIVVNGKKHVFHLLPSGMLHGETQAVIGSGVVVHLETLLAEMDALSEAGIDVTGRLFISDRAHIVTDMHKELDGQQEDSKGTAKIGTTKRGIGPTYEDKAARVGLRMCDFLDEATFNEKIATLHARHSKRGITVSLEDMQAHYASIRSRITPLVCDTAEKLHMLLSGGERILIEGANGALLDIDYGTYPYVTSSNTVTGGACTGLGLPPQALTHVIGVVKAYTTRVGEGPFPTELLDTIGDQIREIGGEFGSTTGRPRRCGWLDIPLLRYAIRLNGINSINLTKLDVLSTLAEIRVAKAYTLRGKEIKSPPARLNDWSAIEIQYDTLPGWNEDISNARTFEELPEACRAYVEYIENALSVPIKYIGVGPGREAMIARM